MHDRTVGSLWLMAEPTCFSGMKRRHTQAIANSKWNITVLCSASVMLWWCTTFYVLPVSCSDGALRSMFCQCQFSDGALRSMFCQCHALMVHYILCSASVMLWWCTTFYFLPVSVLRWCTTFYFLPVSCSDGVLRSIFCQWWCTTMQYETFKQQNTILLQTCHCCLHKLSIWMCQWINKIWKLILRTWSSAQAILSPSMTS
jgi:hypothetical protein